MFDGISQLSMNITVPPTLDLEHESLLFVEQQLHPWRHTRVAQGDDFGRDGFVQIVDRDDSNLSMPAPECFAIQVKATAGPFSDSEPIRLTTRHLRLWSRAMPVVVAAWSRASQEVRWRLATEIIADLRVGQLQDQETVQVPFRTSDSFDSPGQMREQLHRRIADCYDRLGGVQRFHSSIRRVLLTDLYPEGRSNTSQGYTLEGTKGDLHFEHGPSWKNGDLNPAEVYAPRVLTGALFLYEKVWYPLGATETVVRALGTTTFANLIKEQRLVPYKLQNTVGTGWEEGLNYCEIVWTKAPGSPQRQVGSQCREFARQHDLGTAFAVELEQRVRILEDVAAERIKKETLRDLARPELRRAIGLGSPKEGAREALWDSDPVRRLIHLNEAAAVAEASKVDVIELESGLAKVGATKWYSTFGFKRTFKTQLAFDEALEEVGVPDVGIVAATLGAGLCARLSSGQRAQHFRDWFWSTAAHAAAGGADITAAMLRELRASLPKSAEAVSLPCELKLRFFEKIGRDYIIGSSGLWDSHRFAARSMGTDRLRIQAANHRDRRLAHIRHRLGRLPERNSPCPCGSERKFKVCCGRPVL